ncbi:MAG: NADP-dependent malic enzyme [Rhodospirillaceae bacterium]|nr:NADP-dependent malic enzyme [Rhodospirillaceae bacterium]
MTDKIDQAALNYHENPKPGKLEVVATKPLATQRTCARACARGAAGGGRDSVREPANSSRYAARGIWVAGTPTGTAVLGLGAIGPLASKPVMEGKAVLFKKFAGIDVFDIEIDETDPKKMIDIIASLEPTFGAINLEDIKAPECFTVERELRKRMNIPVFHDDQHGTAIVSGAAIFNGLRVVGKEFADVKLVSTGGGAAGIACLNLLVSMGLKPENITLVDRIGVVYKGRKEEMDPQKDRYAIDTKARKLDDVIDGADIFLGLSAPGVLTKDMVSRMADKPIIMALANPEPEITPDDVKSVRSDAVIATGRSDFPNQVNNVLCFPFIFRGALDVGATTINEKMKVACVKAIANLAMAESSDVVASAYSGEDLMFGPEYLIPKPFDPRLIVEIAPAIAKAAMDSGVATRPIEDFDAYLGKLNRFVFRSGMLMKPVFERAKRHPKRLVYTEGESRRVLRAVQVVVDEGLARPVLIGRPDVIESRIEKLGLRLKVERDYDLCNPEDDPRYEDYWRTFHKIVERKGVSPDAARTIVRTNTTVIAALMVYRGEADTMICGTYGQYTWHLKYILDVLGLAEGVRDVSALSALILPKGTFFFCDTHITKNPSVDELVEMTAMASDAVRRFGEVPKVALLSHSNFGSDKSLSAQKMAAATRILRETLPDLEVEGEMHADSALNEELRTRIFPNSRLSGQANLLIFPTLDAANAAFNLAKSLGEGISVGPILLGAAKPVHILTPSITVRGIVNMSAVAVVDAHIASKNAES